MSKRTACILLTWLLMSGTSMAGELFGTLYEGGKAALKGIKIEIVSPKKTYSTETDMYGSYRLFVPEKGRCTLNVYYKDQTLVLGAYSYDKSTRYDLNLVNKDGKYSLKRK
jgi:hypothetical protein